MMVLTPRHEPLPEDTEARLTDFTELVATAIANAESREALAELADEQAALRHVATLVAQGASPEDLFEAVAEEVGRLLPVGSATMGRFEPDGSVTTMASWSTTEAAFPTGMRWPTEGTNVAWMVLQTGRSARLDDFSAATDPIGVAARAAGIKSAVGSPVVVKGHLWGVMTATSTEGPLPTGTEARLASFTELVATAIANAESLADLAASRARIAAAADDERRRVVRDLHDGAQQRLVQTVISLKLAEQALANGAENGPLLVQEALGNAEQAMAGVRELAHGILPSVLTQGGLRAGIDALGSRTPVPVEVDVSVDRLPAPVEASAYFVVAEALTNVAKHSSAGHAEVVAQIDDGTLRVEVRDDGVGGASPMGPGWWGSPTASPCSTAGSKSTARRAAARALQPRSRCRRVSSDGASDPNGPGGLDRRCLRSEGPAGQLKEASNEDHGLWQGQRGRRPGGPVGARRPPGDAAWPRGRRRVRRRRRPAGGAGRCGR